MKELGCFLNWSAMQMVPAEQDRRSQVEQLLQLHKELDRRERGSGIRHVIRLGAASVAVSLLGFVAFQVAKDVGFGLEMGLILLVGLAVASLVFVSDRLRIRELRRRVAEIEGSRKPEALNRETPQHRFASDGVCARGILLEFPGVSWHPAPQQGP